jgi:indolepyruvate ferredoxin oxidoreductase alpha subunit
MLIKSKGEKKNFTIEVKEDCANCATCLEDLACPAIYQAEDGSITIDSQLCRRCSVCIQVCPEKAIGVKK